MAQKPHDPQLLWLYENILPKVNENMTWADALILAGEIVEKNAEMNWRISATRLSKFIPANDRRQHSLREIADQEIHARNLPRQTAGQHVSDDSVDPTEWFEKHAVPYMKAGLESAQKNVSQKMIRKFGTEVLSEDFWRKLFRLSDNHDQILKLKELTVSQVSS